MGIGIVVVEGEIVDGEVGLGCIGGDLMVWLICKVCEDEVIKVVVLCVNLFGGSVFVFEVVCCELELIC